MCLHFAAWDAVGPRPEKFSHMTLPDRFLDQDVPERMYESAGIGCESIVAAVLSDAGDADMIRAAMDRVGYHTYGNARDSSLPSFHPDWAAVRGIACGRIAADPQRAESSRFSGPPGDHHERGEQDGGGGGDLGKVASASSPPSWRRSLQFDLLP